MSNVENGTASEATEGMSRTPDPATQTRTSAGLDEVGGASDPVADGVGADGEEQNPPLPDWGPTDGVHGTDAELDDTDAATS
ncbi:hypothetical protein [Rathayibacter iranicus]|uniref:Uncharacterized protein n=2 Tax=Rathayibacter iranicus TaxID=59737 RepID=A0AAD1EMJ3_9MICO|nr:hypothetical protein [Rathayibacter iranicus]AZZ56158.1 hypothetical protein C7V51_09885 [Rathayibacter iranicus]MWV30143.1 hypothetical protein [Rathayibacter iranicus NCPPB 2253 = VKM Ac-1602]PPI46226.1 hypothetical protein C5E09_08880 [Rathayibacter iranicus]PPI59600.1 hypothetical protein C5E08_09800 [Rathayibacter iranicus]PPI71078.1 hypothetical protein C5E01_08845 [Rathayibacter iranicus]